MTAYLDTCVGDISLAADLYVWNAQLAGACIEVIHHVEVLVRNAIHCHMRSAQTAGGLRSWLVDPDVLLPGELRTVSDAVARIRRLKRPVTEDRVVAGLPLSFWTRLLGTRYDELWKSTLHGAFPHGPALRREVAGRLNRVSQLRNDVAHHKSLLGVPVADRHRDLLELAAAVDPDAAEWIGGLSGVPGLLARSPIADA